MVRNYTSYGFSRFISMNKLNISNLISIQENMTVFNSNKKLLHLLRSYLGFHIGYFM